jgi:putative transposase
MDSLAVSTFGPEYARKIKKRRGDLGDTWYLDEVFIKIGGELHSLTALEG